MANMNIRKILIALMPVLLFACTTLKPVEKLTDTELIDKYYKTDLDLYMVKRDAKKIDPYKSGNSGGDISSENGYRNRDVEKINQIEGKLEIMKQELLKRGYIP